MVPRLASVFASSVVVVAACAGGGSNPGHGTITPPRHPGDVQGPGPIDLPPTPKGMPGVAYIDLACSPPTVNCNGQAFEMHVVGDKTDFCRLAGAPTELTAQIRNKKDPSQTLTITVPGYGRAGRYTINTVVVSQGLSLPGWRPGAPDTCSGGTWTGPPSAQSATVGAPYPSCGSSNACVVDITDPDAPALPRHIRFHVTCASVCMNNDDVKCTAPGGGQFAFDASAMCGS